MLVIEDIIHECAVKTVHTKEYLINYAFMHAHVLYRDMWHDWPKCLHLRVASTFSTNRLTLTFSATRGGLYPGRIEPYRG